MLDEPKIEEFGHVAYATSLGGEYIRGLDVAMDQSVPMSFAQRTAGLAQEMDHAFRKATASVITKTRDTALRRWRSNVAVSSARRGLVPSTNPTAALETPVAVLLATELLASIVRSIVGRTSSCGEESVIFTFFDNRGVRRILDGTMLSRISHESYQPEMQARDG